MNELEPIKQKIYVIRGQRVMLDFDLATMYGVETRALNQAVKRNIERFPEDFMFQLTKGEYEILKSQIATSNIAVNQGVTSLTSQNVILKQGRGQHKKYMPYAFTEQGVAMLSSVLHSPLAIQVNIGIIRAFVEIRRMAASLPQTAADVAQLRRDFEELKLDIEEILANQNDINGMALCLAMLATTEGLSSQRSEGSLRPYLYSCSARCHQHRPGRVATQGTKASSQDWVCAG